MLVIVACAVLAFVPVRLIRFGLNELLEGAPAPELTARIEAVIETVRAGFELPQPILRVGKVGQKVYVEVDLVVPAGVWTLAQEDDVRRAVIGALEPLELDVWAYVALTSDTDLAT